MCKILIGILFVFSSLFCACDNTLDGLAPYKEIPVVYAILNSADSVHYIKINKAFLGAGDAKEFAKERDSLYLPYDLDVELIGSKDNSIKQRITCAVVKVSKEIGLFNAADEVYVTPVVQLDSSLTYTLEIRNQASQQLLCSASAKVIGNFKLAYPDASLVLYSQGKYSATTLSWLMPENAFRYDLELLVSYSESNKITGAMVYKTVSLPLVKGASASGVKNQEQSFTFKGELIYTKLALTLKADSNVVRKLDRDFRYKYSLAGDNLDKYLSLNEPLLTLSDVKPEYTNIKNGLGIFSSRFNKYVKAYLNDASYQELLHGSYTEKLNFE